jgi:hypothetical protein
MPDHKPVMPDLIGHPWIPVCTGMTALKVRSGPVMPDLIGHPWIPVCTGMTAQPFKRYP